MPVEEIVTPFSVSSGTPSAVKSYFSPISASSATSPAALWPNLKFSPTTTRAACSWSTSTARTNSSGPSRENSSVNGSTQTASTPRPASSCDRRVAVPSSGGWEPGRTTSSGCGSKVITTTGSPSSAAAVMAWRTIRWWPRWTPSNSPMVTTDLPHRAGTSSRPCHRCICSFPRSSAPAAMLLAEDRQRPRLAAVVGQQCDQRAVWPEGSHRGGPGPGRVEPGPVPDRARLGCAQFTPREGGGCRLGQVGHVEASSVTIGSAVDNRPGELVQRARLAHQVGPHPGTAEHREVPADVERRAEVPSEGPDVGPAGARHRHVHVKQFAVLADGQHVKPADSHGPRRQLRRPARPRQLVRPPAADLDRADARRDLTDLARQPGDGAQEPRVIDCDGGNGADNRPLCIVGIGRLT